MTGGYVLEWDYRKGADYNVYLGSDSGYVGVKDPEHDRDREDDITNKGISSQQKSYISNHLNKVDGVLRGSGFTSDSTGWKKYIDEDSAVDYYIAMEFMKPVDGNMWASVYMYKQRDSSAGAEDACTSGRMWDFDLAAGSANRAGNVISSSGWYLRNNLQVSACSQRRRSPTPGSTASTRTRTSGPPSKARWNEVEGPIERQRLHRHTEVHHLVVGEHELLERTEWRQLQLPASASTSDQEEAVEQRRELPQGWAIARKSWINGQL